MSSYAVFRIGDIEFGQIRNEVDAEVLAVFTDAMVERRTVQASEHYDWWADDYPTEQESREEDHEISLVTLTGPAPVIAARLDLMGVTETEVRALLEEEFRTRLEHWSDEDFALLGPDVSRDLRAQRAAAKDLTMDEWREAVRNVDAALWANRPFQAGSAGWMLEFLDDWEWRHVLRVLLTIWPDEQVELDLTDLFEAGWIELEEAASLPSVACHEHGTALSGFLPGSWDHLGCQSWDHPARLAGGSSVRPLDRRVMSVDAEVVSGGIQGGQRG